MDKSTSTVKDGKIECPFCRVKYNVPANKNINYPIIVKCKKCSRNFTVSAPEPAKKQDKLGVGNGFNIKKEEPSKNTKKQKQEKFTVTKYNVVLSVIIAVLYGVAIILMPLYTMAIISSFLTLIIFTSITSWIVWRVRGRKEKGGSLTFKIVLITILLARFGLYAVNAVEQQASNEMQQKEKSEQVVSVKSSPAENSPRKVEPGKNTATNNDKQEQEKIVEQAEAFATEHLREIGYQVDSVELIEGMNMAPGYTALVFLYKMGGFTGAYFLSPQSNSYVIYNTPADMEVFRSMLEMALEDRKAKIKADFKKLAGFEFPNE